MIPRPRMAAAACAGDKRPANACRTLPWGTKWGPLRSRILSVLQWDRCAFTRHELRRPLAVALKWPWQSLSTSTDAMYKDLWCGAHACSQMSAREVQKSKDKRQRQHGRRDLQGMPPSIITCCPVRCCPAQRDWAMLRLHAQVALAAAWYASIITYPPSSSPLTCTCLGTRPHPRANICGAAPNECRLFKKERKQRYRP